jgi:hypothetical protein
MSRGRPAVRRRLACALCLLVLEGCSGTDVHPVANDPLLGPGAGTPVSRNVPTPTGPASTGTGVTPVGGRAEAPNELQALPAPARPRVTAADLASGVDQTLDAGPTLRIGTGAPAPKPAETDPGRGPGMTLQPPIPVTELRAPALSAGRPQTDTLQQWLDLLKQRGVTTHGPEKTETGEYRFLGLVADRQDPKKFYRYEASAAGDPINAVRAVIDQMQRDGR